MSRPERSLIGRLFHFLWTLVSFVYRLIFVTLFLVIGLGIWVALRGGPPAVVEDNVALVLWPTGALVEQDDQEPGSRALQEFSGETPPQTSVHELTEALRLAADDERISLAVLKLDDLWSAGLPQIEELRAAVAQFRASGKTLHVHGGYFDQTQYLAAAAASEISLDPQGAVLIEGFASYPNFFKDALDKLGVTVNVFRVGEFKSAVEPFTRRDMSEEAKAANRDWLGDLWRHYDGLASGSRQLEPGAVDAYVREFDETLAVLKGDTAAYAKARGLVDQVETLAQFRARIAETTGTDPDHGSFRQIHYREYLGARRATEPAAAADRIGLVVVQGELVDGYGGPGLAGGDQIAELLDQARRDESVAAVVLRVDSPGGSVWASEQVRRGVQALKAEGKPVVASFSSLAASGGYWVSMDADRIVASPATITGSIGIFAMIPTLEQPLGKLGITTDGVATTELAGGLRLDRPLAEPVKRLIQLQIEKGYADFLEGVASGRSLALAKVDEIARGRVWSGEDALALGLVDQLGDFQQALNLAAELAGLEPGDWTLQPFTPEMEFRFGFLADWFGALGQQLGLARLPGVEGWLAEQWVTVQQREDWQRLLRSFSDPRGLYAHCECRAPLGGRH
ncbi:MAG TPA: signal peptide peptidase SppA [Nevskiaceae bacterium]|nr:signal peptide peptidase SppA [Nevskiaceae bacterium]